MNTPLTDSLRGAFAGHDLALGHLRQARALLLEERDDAKKPSRELSVALTEIDTAILWRQEDLRLKQPAMDQDQS
jgi:hypothetical protein